MIHGWFRHGSVTKDGLGTLKRYLRWIQNNLRFPPKSSSPFWYLTGKLLPGQRRESNSIFKDLLTLYNTLMDILRL